MEWTQEKMRAVCDSLKVKFTKMVEEEMLENGQHLYAVRFKDNESVGIILRNKEDDGSYYYDISHMEFDDGVPMSVSDDDITEWTECGWSPWEGFEEEYQEDKKEMEADGEIYMEV